MTNVVIFGAPGSGKGTQSENIIAKYGFKHFSTGDILRKQIADQTELGKVAKQFIDEGKLVTDELITKAFMRLVFLSPKALVSSLLMMVL